MSTEANKALFQAFTFKNGLHIRNRIAMAPMTTWASNDDATISDDEANHYRARVKGVGMVITGCTRVLANGQGFTDEYAAYDDRFIPSLEKLADAAKSGGAAAIMQIYHAGNKAAAELIPDGDLVSASAVKAGPVPFVKGEAIPRALSHAEILETIHAFGETTRRAIEAGFDGIELHGAHGFLIQNFLSPYFNQRNDEWGGTSNNRMRFPVAVVQEVQRVIKAHAQKPFLLGYRFSPEESQEGGLKIADSCELIDHLIDLKIDYVHASLTSLRESKPVDAEDGGTLAQLITIYINGRIPIIAAGQIKTPEQASEAMNLGLTMVAIGKGLIINPDWVELAAKGQPVETVLHTGRLKELHIPEKLWKTIETTKGWFPLVEENQVLAGQETVS